MKGIGWGAVLVLFFLLAACNKDNGNLSPDGISLQTDARQSNPVQQSVVASNWQTVEQWQHDEKGYHAHHRLPVKAKGGKLLLFARNVWAADAPMEEPMEDLALQLPFHFMPYTNQPGLKETWQYEVADEEVKIDLKVEGGELHPRQVQVRSLYIPDSEWAKITAAGDGDLAYESLVHRLNIKP